MSFCIVRDVSFSEETENSRDHLRFWRPRDTILSDRNTRTTTGRERCARHPSHLDFYGSNDSFCRLPQRSLSRCVYSRARRRRAREYRADAKNDAREREKYARLFLAGVARFVQVARARARDFFPRVQHTETNTIQETKKRGEKRRLSLSRKCPHQQNARLNDARSKNHALLRTRTRTHPSTLPRSTIFTAQNVGDIAEKRDAVSKTSSSCKSASASWRRHKA